jgi:hypothetical protein
VDGVLSYPSPRDRGQLTIRIVWKFFNVPFEDASVQVNSPVASTLAFESGTDRLIAQNSG